MFSISYGWEKRGKADNVYGRAWVRRADGRQKSGPGVCWTGLSQKVTERRSFGLRALDGIDLNIAG